MTDWLALIFFTSDSRAPASYELRLVSVLGHHRSLRKAAVRTVAITIPVAVAIPVAITVAFTFTFWTVTLPFDGAAIDAT